METCLERCSLLITVFIPSHQTEISAIYSEPEVLILSCPDGHLICTNDLSSLTVCLILLIYELSFTYVCIDSCNLSAYAAAPIGNGQPQPSVAETLLFPVQTFGTAYQPTCVFRHCRRQLLHDTWRHCSAALNDICLPRVWVFKAALFISDFIIIIFCPPAQSRGREN